MASGCTGSLCASLCPNTWAFSFLAKGTRTRAWPKTTATPPCTASRSPAPRIIPTSSRLLPPYTFPTFRKSFSLLQTERCSWPQDGGKKTAFLKSTLLVFVAPLWLKMIWRCCLPAQEPWSKPSNSSSKSLLYCLSFLNSWLLIRVIHLKKKKKPCTPFGLFVCLVVLICLISICTSPCFQEHVVKTHCAGWCLLLFIS